jgi:putative serine protease PepD
VRVDAPGGPVGGSGVVFGRAEVLTSATLLGTTSAGLTISTSDGRVLNATVVGTDVDTDLALLRVDLQKGADLSPARLGSTDALAVGQTVVALGKTDADKRWTGRGVVNAVDRVYTTRAGTLMAGLIETDADPGDTVGGGALLDASGAVIGIIMRAAPGHALPIEVARDVASQLTNAGMVHHGWLGADAVDAGTRPGGGALVTSVVPGGPAAKAGIAPGDVIVQVGEDRVTDRADLLGAISRRRSTDTIGVAFWRATKRLHRDVQLSNPSAKPTA